jgi:hypothetical protein
MKRMSCRILFREYSIPRHPYSLTVRCGWMDQSVANWLREIGIEDGTVFPDLEKWSGGIEVYDGDLTYWGLTQQQARDFAIGNLHFNISGYAQGTDSNNTYIDWFKCQFGYSFAPPDQVAYPGPIF